MVYNISRSLRLGVCLHFGAVQALRAQVDQVEETISDMKSLCCALKANLDMNIIHPCLDMQEMADKYSFS